MNLKARRAVWFGLLLAALAYHSARIVLMMSAMLYPERYPLSPFQLQGPTTEVRSRTEAAAAAGLEVSDSVTRIEGRDLRGYADIAAGLKAAARERRALVVEARGAAGVRTLHLPLPPASAPPSWTTMAGAVVLEVLAPLFFLVVGFSVAYLKIQDIAAWLLLFMMLTFSALARSQFVFLDQLGPTFGTAATLWLAFFASAWPFAMLSFALVFPERLPLDIRLPWLKWLILGPMLAFTLLEALMNLSIANFAWAAPFVSLSRSTGRLGFMLIYVTMSFFFTSLGVKFGTTKNPDALRRLRILMTGATVSMTPVTIIATVALLTGRGWNQVGPDTVRAFAVLMMLIFPLTLAYVVIVHKAMGVGMVIRQGLQYALAQRALRFMQMLVGVSVLFALTDILTDPEQRQVDRLQWIGFALLFVVFMQKGADRFRRWIDRRFFREVVDAENILADLGDRVRLIADRRELLETVSLKIGEALHVPKVAAFIRGESGFVPAFATGYAGDAVALEFGNAGVLTCCVAALQKPQTVYLDDNRSWVRRENIPESDAAKLRELSSEVLIPLRTKTAVEGFLSLGPKASEAAYSPSDLRLLQSVAHQTALALDNSRLVDQVASEVAKRERITREIEIAREVQFTLLPQAAPVIAGLELAGHCRPAAGIGGDYYDFIPLEGERSIGLAIGDIAGKGIPAALLMAGLQAALRGQALAGSRDLSRLMTNINKLIFESSPANRYATFFYGEYRNGALNYVNAGHNAPILLRRDGAVEKLEAGGPVIGLMDFAVFTEASVTVRPGDVLLGYTDGVSECMNPRDEEWGEDRLIALLRERRDVAAADLLGRIMTEADAFASGAKQHDDMTLIVMKVAT